MEVELKNLLQRADSYGTSHASAINTFALPTSPAPRRTEHLLLKKIAGFSSSRAEKENARSAERVSRRERSGHGTNLGCWASQQPSDFVIAATVIVRADLAVVGSCQPL